MRKPTSRDMVKLKAPPRVSEESLARRMEHYKAGESVQAAEASDPHALTRYIYDNGMSEDPVDQAFFEAGFRGRGAPTYESGWRYGKAPESGMSYNFQDNSLEPGVSMMDASGGGGVRGGTYEMFNAAGKKVHHYSGWRLNHTTGADGEPLFVGARKL